ncbi:MAG: ribosome silencing factor [Lentisphaerae bacterium GWF2_44_16]|nr:MAG: ribosome silencing factor [Lentisphaerae bacterium GWF2_44_16]
MSVKKEETKKALQKLNPQELASLCAEIAEDRKAENIIQLRMTELSSLADYFVLCTGNSEPHIRAISERIARDVRERTGKHARSVEGTPESKWMVIDLGDVIVHILSPEMRELYQIESLWGDAPKVDAVKKLKKASSRKKKSETAG